MFISYLIILHGFIAVLSSTTNHSSLISIINSIKSRDKLSSSSITFTTARTTYHKCQSDILSQWFCHLNIQIYLQITSNKGKVYKNSHSYARLHHFINDIYLPTMDKINRFTKLSKEPGRYRSDLTTSRFSRKLLETLINKRNRTTNSVGESVGENRITTIANRTRIRRELLRENTIDDEEDANVYGDNDGRHFNDHHEEMGEQRQDFNGDYYSPSEKRFKMRDDSELYEDDIDHINHAYNGEHDTEKRFMQNDEELINPDRLLNDDNNRQYVKVNHKINHDGKKYHEKTIIEKDLDDYNRILKKRRGKNGKKYLKNSENNYLNPQDQLENEDQI